MNRQLSLALQRGNTINLILSALLLAGLWLYSLPAYTAIEAADATASERYESNRYHFSVQPTPGWVMPSELASTDNKPDRRGQSIKYLLSEWQTNIAISDATEYSRVVYTPKSKSGLQEAAKIELSFQPSYQQLVIHQIRLQRDGQWLNRLQADKIRLIQQERDIEQDMYNGEVSALIILDDVRVGDIIDYAYSIVGRNPVFGDQFFTSYSLGWKVAVDRVVVRILAPKQRQLNTQSYNIELQPRISTANGVREYVWQLDHTQPLKQEGNSPKWYDPYPWLQVSEYASWHDVSRWVDALYQIPGKLSPELQQQIDVWRAESDNDEEVIRKALHFVQDQVRYFGVEMGQNSHRPSHPDEVFSRRYGDCKDKAVLLSAILRALGHKAQPALVSMDYTRAVADWLPSPGVFDHVIVHARINGQLYWFDATKTYQRGELNRREIPDYGKALLVGSRSKKLTSIELPKDYMPEVNVEEQFIVSAYNQPVEFIVTSRFSYGEAEWKRYYIDNKSLDEIGEVYLNYYARIYPGIEMLEPIEVIDDEIKNIVTIIERYSVPEYWEREEGRMYSNFYGSSIRDYTDLPTTVNRKAPLAQSYPVRIRHSSVLQYPEDIDFEGIDDELVIEDDAMRFVQRSSYQDRQLQVEYIYQTHSDAVMPERVRGHLAKRREINDSLHFSAWVTDYEQRKAEQALYEPPQKILDKILSHLSTD